MSRPDQPIILGTRASPLAMAQSGQVAAALCAAHDWPEDAVRLHEIITRGDKQLEQKLSEIGGKGLFTEELEAGLRDGSLDMAVHSLKDLPTETPDGLHLAAIAPRAAAHDVLITAENLPTVKSLADLPQGARIGTASLRRQAQILAQRPDVEIVPVRGNIQTRLAKIDSDNLHGIILAAAGLDRMGLTPPTAINLDGQDMLPAAGQGALAIEVSADNHKMIDLLAPLHCTATAACVAAERAFLNALDGNCRTPIAANGTLDGTTLSLTGRLLAEDGSEWVDGEAQGPQDKAAALGRHLAERLKNQAPHLVTA